MKKLFLPILLLTPYLLHSSCQFEKETGYTGTSLYGKEDEVYAIVNVTDPRYGTTSTVYNAINCKKITSGDKSKSNFAQLLRKKGFEPLDVHNKEILEGGSYFDLSLQETANSIVVNVVPVKSVVENASIMKSVQHPGRRKKPQTTYNHTEKTFDHYMTAFYLDGDVTHLQKAEALAKTPDEKQNLEKAYIDFVEDYKKIFRVSVKEYASGKSETSYNDYELLDLMSNYKNAKFQITLSKNPNSPVPLKYGDYKVKLHVSLKVNYSQNMHIKIFGMSTYYTKTYSKDLFFSLNRKNNFRQNIEISFEDILAGTEASMYGFVRSTTKITNIALEHKIVDIDTSAKKRYSHSRVLMHFPNIRENIDETFTDYNTNLMWQQDNVFSDSEAEKVCQNISTSDYTNWRVPTLSEIKSIKELLKHKYNNGYVYNNGTKHPKPFTYKMWINKQHLSHYDNRNGRYFYDLKTNELDWSMIDKFVKCVRDIK